MAGMGWGVGGRGCRGGRWIVPVGAGMGLRRVVAACGPVGRQVVRWGDWAPAQSDRAGRARCGGVELFVVGGVAVIAMAGVGGVASRAEGAVSEPSGRGIAFLSDQRRGRLSCSFARRMGNVGVVRS